MREYEITPEQFIKVAARKPCQRLCISNDSLEDEVEYFTHLSNYKDGEYNHFNADVKMYVNDSPDSNEEHGWFDYKDGIPILVVDSRTIRITYWGSNYYFRFTENLFLYIDTDEVLI